MTSLSFSFSVSLVFALWLPAVSAIAESHTDMVRTMQKGGGRGRVDNFFTKKKTNKNKK